jgi:hypothetical protein
MLRFFILALLPLQVLAVDIWEGESANLNCDGPTHYTNGDPIEAGDTITYKLYQDGTEVQTGVPECTFTVSPTVGAYLYNSTAVSALYGSESLPSNDAEVVVNVKKRLMAPSNLTATVVQ